MFNLKEFYWSYCFNTLLSISLYSLSLFFLPATVSANLITNSSFEDVPSSAGGQDLMPSDWVSVYSTPDTYSNDGSYGLSPSGYRNFPGVSAYDGIRWVAGWSSQPEQFGQMLAQPLIAGHEYLFTGFLHQAIRSDLNYAGGYNVYLAESSTYEANRVLLGFFGSTSTNSWEAFDFRFIAPDESIEYQFLLFDPIVTAGTGSAYAGVDNVSLSQVPLPASVWLLVSGLLGMVSVVAKFRVN